MIKNDVVVRTAKDLEKKYNFAKVLGLYKNIETTHKGIVKLNNELNNILNSLFINLKDVLDSQSDISLWFYSGIPKKTNFPYTSWNNPSQHIGDLYYDRMTGFVYQYDSINDWIIKANADLVEAMAITNSAIDTQDNERKVFFSTPTPPYSNGDWWIQEDGNLYICQISKNTGMYEKYDFISSNNYIESIASKIGDELKVLKGTVLMISENYAKFTDLATGGSTIINGSNITTGSIDASKVEVKNLNASKITSGTIDASKIGVTNINASNIKTGTLDASKVSVTNLNASNITSGTISANRISGGTLSGSTVNTNSGNIGGWHLNSDGLYNGSLFIHNNGYSNIYTYADMVIIRNYLLGKIDLSENDISHYDLNSDGEVDSGDLLLMRRMIIGS